MKGKFTLLLMMCALSGGAQILSPENAGDFLRAEAMQVDDNFIGTLDQLLLTDMSVFTSDERQRAVWTECCATVRTDPSLATELLRQYLADYPAAVNRFEAMMLLGDCLLPESASEALRIYDAIDPSTLSEGKRAALCYHKGYALMHEGNPLVAASFFEKARRDHAWQKPADFYLAQIALMQGDFPRALSLAQSLLQGKGNDSFGSEMSRVAGQALFALGDSKEALKYLRRYVNSVDEPDRNSLYIIGVEEFKLGHSSESIDFLSRVAAFPAEDAVLQSACLYIGQAKMLQGDYDGAALAFEKAMKMDFDPEVAETAYYDFAVAKSEGGRVPFSGIAAAFEQYLQRYPEGTYVNEVQEYIVDGYISEGNYEAALTAINKIKNPPAKISVAKQKALYALGMQSLAKGNTDSAIRRLEEAAAMTAGDRETRRQASFGLGEALAKEGRHGEAVGRFQSYVSSAKQGDVNLPTALYDLGYSLMALGKYSEAAQAFSKIPSNTLQGDSRQAVFLADVQNRIGDNYLYLNLFDKAEAAYRKAMKLQPSAADYPLYGIALTQGYRRDYKDKISTLQLLIDKFPTSPLVPDALLGMTEAYIQTGDNNSAISAYRRLVSEYSSTEQGRKGYIQMALTLLNTGRREEALEAYRDVVKLYPTSDEARMAVDELKRLAAEDGTLPALAQWLASIDNAPRLETDEADRLAFEAAEEAWLTSSNISRVASYLADYPEGNFRAQALAYMMENAYNLADNNEVVEYSSQIITAYPDSPYAEQALKMKADALYSLGEAGEALEVYSILETRASSAEMLVAARTGIIRAARDTGSHERVIAAADALLASSMLASDAVAEARFARAFALARSGRESEAAAEWLTLSKDPSDINGAKSAYYLAEYYFNSDDLKQAGSTVQAFIDSGSPHIYWIARAFILLSDIYFREGKEFEAREYLKSLRDNYPGTETDIFSMIDERLGR